MKKLKQHHYTKMSETISHEVCSAVLPVTCDFKSACTLQSSDAQMVSFQSPRPWKPRGSVFVSVPLQKSFPAKSGQPRGKKQNTKQNARKRATAGSPCKPSAPTSNKKNRSLPEPAMISTPSSGLCFSRIIIALCVLRSAAALLRCCPLQRILWLQIKHKK